MHVLTSRPELAELENHVRTHKWHALGLQLGLDNNELVGIRSQCLGLWLKQTEPIRQKLLDAY